MEKPSATLGSQSQSSSSGSGSLNPSSGPAGSSASTVPVSPVLQSPAPPLLQDPTLLRQLLPALQTALQLNNASVDMAKINEGESASIFCERQCFKISIPVLLDVLIVKWSLCLMCVLCLQRACLCNYSGRLLSQRAEIEHTMMVIIFNSAVRFSRLITETPP